MRRSAHLSIRCSYDHECVNAHMCIYTAPNGTWGPEIKVMSHDLDDGVAGIDLTCISFDDGVEKGEV